MSYPMFHDHLNEVMKHILCCSNTWAQKLQSFFKTQVFTYRLTNLQTGAQNYNFSLNLRTTLVK